jgi:hypothetical protein
MPACTLQREVNGSTALYRIAGRFADACAGDLKALLDREPLYEVVVDFSQVHEFVDSGVAVIAASLTSPAHRIFLRGLRQHQERLFRYFGIEPEVQLPVAQGATVAEPAKEVA